MVSSYLQAKNRKTSVWWNSKPFRFYRLWYLYQLY